MFFFISKLLCDTPESPPLKIVESISFGMPTPLSLTEKQAFVNLQALAKDSIVLLISHRLYLFPEMDGVIWMENGKAVTGTHEELLKTVPEYENLYTSQVHTTENGGAEHDAQKTSENGDL